MCWTSWWLLLKLFKHCWHWCGLISPPIPLPGADGPFRCMSRACCICIALLCMKIYGGKVQVVENMSAWKDDKDFDKKFVFHKRENKNLRYFEGHVYKSPKKVVKVCLRNFASFFFFNVFTQMWWPKSLTHNFEIFKFSTWHYKAKIHLRIVCKKSRGDIKLYKEMRKRKKKTKTFSGKNRSARNVKNLSGSMWGRIELSARIAISTTIFVCLILKINFTLW